MEIFAAYMPFVWIGIAVIFGIVEGATMGLVTIWFTVGAGAAAVAAALDAPIFVQMIIFIVVSLVLLVFTRPILKQKLKLGKEKNNIELYVGQTGMVIEDIKPFNQGRIKLKSLEWAAVGDKPEIGIDKGKEVRVVRIEGVKAIVEPLSND